MRQTLIEAYPLGLFSTALRCYPYSQRFPQAQQRK
jgi:hypothetical protein